MNFVEPFIDAIIKGDEAAVSHLLLMGASINRSDENGLSPLHWSASSAEAELLVPFLILHGAILEAKDLKGRTPLHMHCAQGRTYGAACLLHQGANVNIQSSDTGSTPLHYAVKHKHADISKLLLGYGAKSSISNFAKEKVRDLGLAELTG